MCKCSSVLKTLLRTWHKKLGGGRGGWAGLFGRASRSMGEFAGLGMGFDESAGGDVGRVQHYG